MKKSIATILFLFVITTQLFAQNEGTVWQYSAYPDLPFTLENLELDMSIDPQQPMLISEGSYSIISRHPELTEVVFNTSESQIEGILVDGTEADFSISSDSLIITLAEPLGTGNAAEIVIK